MGAFLSHHIHRSERDSPIFPGLNETYVRNT